MECETMKAQKDKLAELSKIRGELAKIQETIAATEEKATSGMTLGALEGKPLRELTQAEREFIVSAYLRYFDTLKPRERCMGYCVVYCGIPATRIGELNIGFRESAENSIKVEYALFQSAGEAEIRITNNTMEDLLFDYIKTESRFMEKFGSDSYHFPTNEWEVMPLFLPKIDRGNTKLRDCRTFLSRAGKAIGFDASHIVLHKLRNTPYFSTPLVGLESAKKRLESMMRRIDALEKKALAIANDTKLD